MSVLQRTCALLLAASAVASTALSQAPLTDFPFALGSGSSLFAITPCRVLDTRTDNLPLLSNVSRVFVVAIEQCGIPLSAVAVSANLTVVAPTGNGFVTAFPGDESRPFASTINFQQGQTRANNALLKLSGNGEGTIALYTLIGGSGSTHAVLDVTGYFVAEESEVQYGRTVSGRIDFLGEQEIYTFEGTTGDRVFLRMSAGPVDPQLRLDRPDGSALCNGQAFNLLELSCVLDATGTYTLR